MTEFVVTIAGLAVLAVIAKFIVGRVLPFTVMHTACKRGDIGTVRRMLRRYPDLALAPDHLGRTPLHNSASNPELKDDALVRLLIDNGADVNALDDGGSTPLHSAIVAGNLAAVEALLAHGASPGIVNSSGLTPMKLTGDRDDLEDILKRYGASAADW